MDNLGLSSSRLGENEGEESIPREHILAFVYLSQSANMLIFMWRCRVEVEVSDDQMTTTRGSSEIISLHLPCHE